MSGDGLVRPWYAGAAGAAGLGIQPGTTTGVVNAIQVIVSGGHGGVFIYSPTPGAGNLIESFSNTNFDPFGNHTIPGAWSYGATTAVGFSAGGGGFQFATGSLAAGWTARTALQAVGTQTQLLSSSSLLLTGGAVGTVLTTNANADVSLQNLAGLTGLVPVIQTDTTTVTNANLAGPQPITATYTIPANDMQAGTVYEIEVDFNGVFESQTVTWGISVNGAAPVAQDTIGAAFFAAGVGYVGTSRHRLRIASTGTTGAVTFYLDGGVGQSGTRSSGVNNNNAYLSAGASGTINTTVSNTITVTAAFGAAAVGQTISGTGSTFTRKGT